MSFLEIRFVDVVDIVLVTLILYYLVKLVRGTRATPMLIGLLFILLTSVIASWLGLEALKWLVSSIKTIWLVAFVIIFQPEIRKILLSLGTNRLVRLLTKYEKVSPVDEVVKSAARLADRGLGGLLCLERETGLKEYIETGTRLDAKITTDLISTIFTPDSALHDGAIIIRGSKIVSAGSILPISKNPEIPPELGMRHRAAVGITEETDAICIVVSEETRKVSLAMEGRLINDVNPLYLKITLETAISR
jgi:diadenylate cyclase